MRDWKKALRLSSMAAGLAMLPALAIGQATTDAADAAGQSEADRAAVLSGAMRGEIGNRADTATTEELEGYIMLVLGQDDYSDPVISGALDSLAPGANANLRQAITNVRIAMLRRKISRGTAALSNSGGSFGTSSFTSPSLNLGGGGSNYTS